MGQSELLRYVVNVVERRGLRYLVTGSVATVFFGEPRFTNDLDIVIALPAERVADFRRGRFARALRVKPAADFEASFASIEDVIIKKMEYYREGGSEKRLRDITGVLKISGDRVDHSYVSDWAAKMGLDSIWRAVLERINK